MGVRVYNKLVRDRIPEIIAAEGKSCSTMTLGVDEYIVMLDAKIDEELQEYHESASLEELADLVEVIHAVVKARGWSLAELERVRAEKAAERGAFAQRLLLKEVIE
jgi:predicted house-cleaning noncanonical NTP pyrophosphatase (MazG superfamily)